jgi:hypothetical protein
LTNIYGPYLRKVPPVTVGLKKNENKIGLGDPVDGTAAWWYYPTSGDLHANIDRVKDGLGDPLLGVLGRDAPVPAPARSDTPFMRRPAVAPATPGRHAFPAGGRPEMPYAPRAAGPTAAEGRPWRPAGGRVRALAGAASYRKSYADRPGPGRALR